MTKQETACHYFSRFSYAASTTPSCAPWRPLETLLLSYIWNFLPKKKKVRPLFHDEFLSVFYFAWIVLTFFRGEVPLWRAARSRSLPRVGLKEAEICGNNKVKLGLPPPPKPPSPPTIPPSPSLSTPFPPLPHSPPPSCSVPSPPSLLLPPS